MIDNSAITITQEPSGAITIRIPYAQAMPSQSIFDPSAYYTVSQIDELLKGKVDYQSTISPSES